MKLSDFGRLSRILMQIDQIYHQICNKIQLSIQIAPNELNEEEEVQCESKVSVSYNELQ